MNQLRRVYLIKSQDLYKIGYTEKKVKDRILELKTGNPNKFEEIFEYESFEAKGIEFALHNFFKHKNVEGEWFSLDEKDVESIPFLCKKIENAIEIVNNPISYLFL
jgi:hypothetical protein